MISKKKILCVCLMATMLLCACDKKQDTVFDESEEDILDYGELDEDWSLGETEDDIPAVSNEPIDNFFQDDTYSYNCKSFFDELDVNKMDLSVEQVEDSIYKLQVHPSIDVPARMCGSWDRYELGYFYVNDDVIYMIYGESEIPSVEEFVKPGNVVYVSKEKLADYEGNFIDTKYIEWTDDVCTYHEYNDKVETGFYLSISWNEDKVMTEYRSGFGAERDAVDIYIK